MAINNVRMAQFHDRMGPENFTWIERLFSGWNHLASFDALLANELFQLHSLSVLEPTGSVLEFFTVETRSLFDVFFRGYIAKVEGEPIGWGSLLGFDTEFKG